MTPPTIFDNSAPPNSALLFLVTTKNPEPTTQKRYLAPHPVQPVPLQRPTAFPVFRDITSKMRIVSHVQPPFPTVPHARIQPIVHYAPQEQAEQVALPARVRSTSQPQTPALPALLLLLTVLHVLQQHSALSANQPSPSLPQPLASATRPPTSRVEPVLSAQTLSVTARAAPAPLHALPASPPSTSLLRLPVSVTQLPSSTLILQNVSSAPQSFLTVRVALALPVIRV